MAFVYVQLDPTNQAETKYQTLESSPSNVC